ncbi:hypothetical protein CSB45_06375 [candidate division KSB3 bacterium]|uniref:histidine kinase n=1 Tax=candidate division KSB3 bacterium TaxID=2044937 RepID=A0A2G6E6X3_9BACT|nr:MAG: hypothetical protein CSB45_06375 [candidate division KSB3 bacterium]PIE30269.1 MAG: hypothetical protein CSA57_05090 [candidate division KSB3 bacterium]
MAKNFIICVDDQPEIVGSLMTQLENAVGDLCEIEVAESAAEALEVLDELLEQGEQIDIVITDEIMPGMPGSKFLEIVHQRDPNIMTVILTGQAGFDDVVYAVNHAELDKCIKKPWYYDDLKDTVLELLDKAGTKRRNKQLAEELIAEKNKAEAIVHSITDGIIVFNGNDRISLVNKACTEILGRTEEELIGRRIMDVLELKELILLLIEASHHSDEVVSDEIVLRHSKDPEREIDIIAIAKTLRSRDGQPFGVVTVLRDVAREKEVSRMKSNFLATISHELRTPLTSILSTYELLLQNSLGELTDEQREFISLSKEQGAFLSELLENLIDLMTLSGNQLELMRKAFDLGQLAQEVVKDIQASVSAKGLQLRVDIAPELPEFVADEHKIGRVLKNLLSNAVKFTEKGDVALTISHVDDKIWITVHDSGIGIAEEHFDKIFENFFQVDNTTTREFKGSGAGLAICRAIVLAHRGEIWVESVLNKGTTFHVTLPISATLS